MVSAMKPVVRRSWIEQTACSFVLSYVISNELEQLGASYLQEFNIEKLQLLESEKKKIRQEYERKEKLIDISRKM